MEHYVHYGKKKDMHIANVKIIIGLVVVHFHVTQCRCFEQEYDKPLTIKGIQFATHFPGAYKLTLRHKELLALHIVSVTIGVVAPKSNFNKYWFR